MPPDTLQLAVVGGELGLPSNTSARRACSPSPETAATGYDEELRAAAGLIQDEANIHIRENMKIMEAAHENREAGWKIVCKQFEQVARDTCDVKLATETTALRLKVKSEVRAEENESLRILRLSAPTA